MVPRRLCWVLWPSQGAWLAETGMGFLFGPRTEPFVSGCKHELEGFFGVRVHCWQCLVKSELVAHPGYRTCARDDRHEEGGRDISQ